MGKLKVFEVVFNDEDPLYRAGDLVSGHVRLLLSEPKDAVRGICIKFKGYSKTYWKEKETSGVDESERTRSVTYLSKEFYFHEQLIILGKDETATDGNAAKIVLHAGEHLFPFSFRIPIKPLPHPFEGFYGQVRYKVTAKIDRPAKSHYKTQTLFCIIGAGIDLNTKPDSQIPSIGEDEKSVCCMCCVTGPIKVSAQTNKSCYVPGEFIWVSGVIQNQSSREVIDVTAKLVQTVICLARREVSGRPHTRSQVRVISKVKCEGCDEYSKVSFSRKPLLIPSCPPSGLIACGLIDIQYHVKFDADIGRTPLDTYIYLPITIGTVPRSSSNAVWSPRNGEVITQQPSATARQLQLVARYESSCEGPQSIPNKYGYTFGKLMFAPKYPMYNFSLPDPDNEPPCTCRPDQILFNL
ncbi:arrestin domain-containing protein 3-like [Amphiura filiformis]|uniref:arrestin domain-containing protein 3-like n=1 Tax=Amphiura filiformis TaxID=82378 RepID=UPI003B20CBD4